MGTSILGLVLILFYFILEIIEEPKKINDPTALRKAKDMFAGCMDTCKY